METIVRYLLSVTALTVVCLMLGACRESGSTGAPNNKENRFRVVVAVDSPDDARALATGSPRGVEVANLSPRKDDGTDSLIEMDVSTDKKLEDALKVLQAFPGVEGAAPVAKHSHRLVIQFDRKLAPEEAFQRLKPLNPLTVRPPGNMKKSPYFDVLIESDHPLDAVIASAESLDDVLVAEPSKTYTVE